MRASLIGVALALLTAASAVADPKADAVIAAAKAASGGAAWDAVPGWHESGAHGGVAYESWLDMRQWGMASQSRRGGLTADHRFDGQIVWLKEFDGRSGADASAAGLAAARLTDYLSIRGFFFPDRFPADFADEGAKTDNGKTYDVVQATLPASGAMELWFDQTTHLLARAVIQADQPVTVTFDDYRKVGALMVPFHAIQQIGAATEEGHVGGVEFVPVDRARFSPPAGGQ